MQDDETMIASRDFTAVEPRNISFVNVQLIQLNKNTVCSNDKEIIHQSNVTSSCALTRVRDLSLVLCCRRLQK